MFAAVRRLMGFMGQVCAGVFRVLRDALQFLVGKISWQSPPWAQHIAQSTEKLLGCGRAHPVRALVVLGLLLALVAGGIFGYQWWQTRPRPVEVSFKLEQPTRTEIEYDDVQLRQPKPFVVRFEKSVAPLALVGKEVVQGIQMSPTLAGIWKWTSDKTLEFLPKEDWPVGGEYRVVLERAAIAPQVHLASDEFKLLAPPFVARLTQAVFYQDPIDPAQKKAVIDLNFSHPVNPVEFEKRIELRLAGQSEGVLGVGRENFKFSVSYDKLKLNASIHSAPLNIPKEDTQLLVKVDKGLLAMRGGRANDKTLEKSIPIPGLYSLQVSEIEPSLVTNDRNEPEQVLVAQTSMAVHERDLANAVTAWVLPLYHPKTKKEERSEPYPWNNPKDITEEVLKQSARLPLEPIAAEREYTETHSFKYRAEVGRYVYVQVKPGIRSFGGYLLGKAVHRVMQVPPFPSELKILSEGALLPLSGEKKVAVLVRDLPGIKVEIGRVLPGQLQHLISQANGDFTKPQFYGSFGVDNLTERFERKTALPSLPHGQAHYEAVDLGEYLKAGPNERRGVFLLTVQGYDAEKEKKKIAQAKAEAQARLEAEQSGGVPEGEMAVGEGRMEEGDNYAGDQTPPEVRTDKRLVLVTDLGILVKKGTDGSQDVFVQSIYTGQPVAGATVDVIGKNGLTLFSQTTDATGHARFEKLEGLSRERAPMMYLVKKGGDLSFMPLNRYDRNLDLSRFDIGGIRNARLPDQLNAYLFSDRGIYRPGDTFHIGMIIKSADWKALQGVPLEAEVIDARGLTVKREKLRVNAGGFNELSHTTQETSPTGEYTINLYISREGAVNSLGRQIGSTTVKVQEFQPDRMKVTAHLSSEVMEGWVHPKDLKGQVSVMNLFGTPAENRRIEPTLTLSPAYPAFRSYPDYNFYDPLRAKEGYTEKLPDVTSNETGEAEFALGLEKYTRATYRLHLLTRVFEPEGGRSVAAETATLVSELPFLIGFKADGDLGYVSRGGKRSVALVAINPQAKKMAVEKLNLQLVERKFVSVLTKQGNGTYKYESRKKEILIKSMALNIPAAGFNLALAAETPGNFAYVIRDAQGLELNRVEYSVAGQGNVSRSLERNAELQLTLNKKDYQPGEDIEINIRAPYVGAGLITIEREKVFAHQWFKTSTLASVQKIRLPRDFEGNGYVTVQFIRDPASDEIFMSPLSHGVVPFMTSLSKRTNTLKVSAPELVKPGQLLNMKLSSSQPTRAVLFAVDEGILQVARYRNPDPLGHFFQKRALEVSTAQILDLILPEFKRLMAASAPGGDGEGALGRHLNPFKRKRDKPVVYWSGIIDVKGEREFTYQVPEYFNGSMRIIAVTVNDTAIGVAQSKSVVRGDFVLSPNAPLSVAPGDIFDVSVGVSNNVVGSGKEAAIAINLKVAPHLEVFGDATQTLKVGEMREGVALFKVKARDATQAQLGSASLTFSASLGNKSAKLTTDLSVRPATPHYVQLSAGSFTGTVDVPVKRNLFAEYRHVEAGVSPVPLVLAAGLASYLSNFEHACTEQLISQALPAVVLGKRPEFAANSGVNSGTAKLAARSLDEALRVLRTRQNAAGGFGLWGASVDEDEFASVYATHLLLEARERSENVPADMVQKALEYLQQLAASPARDLHAARARAYAIYLLTRQGTVTTPMLSSLRDTLEAKYAKQWQDDLVAVYLAASYQLLKQDRLASGLIERAQAQLVKRGAPNFGYERYYDPLIRDAQTLYILARHFPDKARSLPASSMLALVKPIQDGAFNTLSAAYTILALDAYATTVGNAALGKLSIAEIGADGKARSLALPQNLIPRVPFAAGTRQLRFGIDSNLTGYYAVTEAGFDRTPPTTEIKAGVEILREYTDTKGNPIKSVKVGDEVIVKLKFRALSNTWLSNMAFVDLLPGGFEPVLQSQAVSDNEGAGLNTSSNSQKSPWSNRLGRGGNWTPEYADIREDRIVLYGNVNNNVSEFQYRIKATNTGTFIVPPAYAESMYNRSVQARSLGGQIVVERPVSK